MSELLGSSLNIKEHSTANTRPTKKLLVEGITRDLSVQACILDLIDNAIDAKTEQGNGFIEIHFDGLSFNICDYASGISRAAMHGNALRFGAVASHEKGIGIFGIGLNRALCKLGKKVEIESETQEERIFIDWDIALYMTDDDNWDIPISSISKIGTTGTKINITKLNNDISSAFSDKLWESNFITELSRRYGYLIRDFGFSIKVNDVLVPTKIPEVRIDGQFSVLKKQYTKDGAVIEVTLGQHQSHKFSYEIGSNEAENEKLTPDFGWSVYCNNRAILLGDWTHKVGWDAEFHSQHYGFVGVIHFKGDPSLLPWSTSKADVDLHNVIYADALKTMRLFSKKWRSHTNKVKNIKKDSSNQSSTEINDVQENDDIAISPTVDPNGDFNGVTNIGSISDAQSPNNTDNETSKPSGTKTHNVTEHSAKWSYLFGPNPTSRITFKVPHTAPKIIAVVNELQKLEVDNFPCSVMLLIRVLIEESCKFYLKNNLDKPDIAKSRNSLAKTVLAYTMYMESVGILNDGNEIASIKSLCNARGEEVLSIEYLQNGIHSKSNFLEGSTLRPLWRDIEPFIKACFSN